MGLITFGFDCPVCECDNEVDIEIESYGSPSSYWQPGEGAIWHTKTEPTCVECGHVIQDEDFDKRYGDRIQERIAEPIEPDYDY